MKKLLVTGADGLLGSAICKVAIDYDVIPLSHDKCDLTDFHSTKAIFNYFKPDFVIHTAAIVGGIGRNRKYPVKFLCSNINMNTNVLESARLVGVKKLISYLSTCIFPDSLNYPFHPRDIHKGPPHPSNAAYAYAKRMLDIQSKAYRSEYGCDFITLIPTNMYGTNDNWDLENGHVLPSLIHKCYLSKRFDKELIVWGSGKPLREFVYNMDVAKLTMLILDEYQSEEPLIISQGHEISIKDVVLQIAEIMEFKNEIVFDETQPDGQFRKSSDASELKQLFPDYKFTSLYDGLKSTIGWFLSHYPMVRGTANYDDPYLQTR